MNRDEIVALIREHYDPEPKDWPRHRGWDDGAGDVADKILSGFKQSGFKQRDEKTDQAVETCPECGILADTMLHRFCTHRYCPARPSA